MINKKNILAYALHREIFSGYYSMPNKKHIYHLIGLKFYSFLAFLFSACFLTAIIIYDVIRKILMIKNNDQVADTKENKVEIPETE
ncbi:MAG TPA: hypothetical protein VIH86_07570 [Puia sp.]|jgi:hypothetical protein